MERLVQRLRGFVRGVYQLVFSLTLFAGVLRKARVVVFEIGGRGGPSFGFRLLSRLGFIEIHSFEPDPQEAQRLQAKGDFAQVYPVALGKEKGKETLYLTAHPGCSSLLKPLAENFCKHSIFNWLQVEAEVSVEVESLQGLSQRPGFSAPHFLNIDVQGAERDLLMGGKEVLSSVLGIKVECRMRSMYQGEALLPEVVALLAEEGFLFRDAKVVGSFDREAVEFDCLFVREGDSLTSAQDALIAWWERFNGASRSRPAKVLSPAS